MPKFLEDKLRSEYGNNARAIYGTMNKIGAMHGNKETAKGREMEAKHEKDNQMKDHGLRRMEIEAHRDGSGKLTGHTVSHVPYEAPKKSKSGAFYQEPKREEYPFSATDHEAMMDHIEQHLAGGAKAAADSPGKPGEDETA